MMRIPPYVMIRVTVVNKYIMVIVIVALCACIPNASAARDFPVPKYFEISDVSSDTTTYGMNFNIRKFETHESPSTVVAFYQQKWGDQAVVTEYGQWTMVGKNTGKQFYNVQVQSGAGGSWGYLSISDLPERIEKEDYQLPGERRFPHMSGSHILNDKQHKDIGKSARTVLLVNNFSVSANGQYYLNYYQGKKWSVVADNNHSKMHTRVMTFQKGSKTVTLTIAKVDKYTNVVANIESASLLP